MTEIADQLEDLAERLGLEGDDADLLGRAVYYLNIHGTDCQQAHAEARARIDALERERVNLSETNGMLVGRLNDCGDALDRAWRHVVLDVTHEEVSPVEMADAIIERTLEMATTACEAAVKVARVDAGGSLDPYDWARVGIDNGWVSDVVCSTHDGIPMKDEEEAEFDEGFDPCVPAIRVWFVTED